MKFGANTQIWCAPFSQKDIGVIDKVADLGFDYIELGFASEEPPFKTAEVKKRIQEDKLRCGVCSFLPGDRDIANPDPEVRRRGVAYMQALIATTAAIGGEILSGPLYAELFRTRYIPEQERQREWEWSVQSLRQVAKSADTHGVTLALEPLNRFETDFLNLSSQAVKLAEDVASKAVGILLDTFHMHIEEKNQGAAIRRAGKHLKHFHTCENDRGSPGTGQVDWPDVRSALTDIGYSGCLVIEGFNPDVVDLANGARIWRPMAPTPDRLASDGLKFLKGYFN